MVAPGLGQTLYPSNGFLILGWTWVISWIREKPEGLPVAAG
jgi:hypothetical protein